MQRLGYDLEALQEQEWDAGLGNGGLGRLAACILDSAATLGLPFYGYGIRYEYGIFQQKIAGRRPGGGARQLAALRQPLGDPPPRRAVPGAVLRPERAPCRTRTGRLRVRWVDTEDVWAMAYDTPVAGYGNDTVNTLRLWSAKSSREFDLGSFNAGDYVRAVEDKTRTENISKVLYPRDDQYAGKELRLKQQYFFVSATLQDVLRRFLQVRRATLEELPAKVADPAQRHPPGAGDPRADAGARGRASELPWEEAWELTQRVFAYTNHTVLPEALETWPADLLRRLLPRHFEIIEEIDRRFRLQSWRLAGDDGSWRGARRSSTSTAHVRMAHLGVRRAATR